MNIPSTDQSEQPKHLTHMERITLAVQLNIKLTVYELTFLGVVILASGISARSYSVVIYSISPFSRTTNPVSHYNYSKGT